MSRNVARCARQSSRLWIWIRSRTGLALGRAPHLGDASLLAARPHLRRDKDARPHSQFGDDIADHGFGAAVHRRAVDHARAGIGEREQHLFERRARGGAVAGVEGLPGAEPVTGIASPEDGTGRVIIVSAAMAFVLTNSVKAAALMPPLMKSRRVIFDFGVIASEAKQSRTGCALRTRLLRRCAPRKSNGGAQTLLPASKNPWKVYHFSILLTHV